MKDFVEKLPVVSLFSGAGGLDKGLELAGFDVVYATDLHPQNCETLRFNFPRSIVVPETIQRLDGKAILNSIHRQRRDVALVAGGPPCQSFSILGNRGSVQDPRGQLIYDYIRVVKEIQPEAFLFENVKGITTVNKGADWKELLNLFRTETGYQIHCKILNAVDYGVPQYRERVIVVGFRERNVDFSWPEPTHVNPTHGLLVATGMPSHLTVATAFKRLSKLPNHEKRIHGSRVAGRYAKIPQGGRDRIDHTDRLVADRPSGTVLVGSSAGGGRPHIHPFEDRHITVREAARLQSFPDDFVFQGTTTWQYRQVGNAVPPLLAKAVGANILAALKKKHLNDLDVSLSAIAS